MFAPTLFIGAMLGAAVGSFEKIYFPHLTGSIGSYALVGMGVLFAAFLRAPLTSVFMVLEVSGNYSIVLPVILANTIAYVISRVLQPIPILEQFTHQDGLDLPSMEEVREESNLHLEDAMQPVTVPVLQASDTIADTIQSLAQYEESKAAPVVLIHCNDGALVCSKKRGAGKMVFGFTRSGPRRISRCPRCTHAHPSRTSRPAANTGTVP